MTTANLNAAVATGGKELLGFQEPDLASGADMTVQASACCRLPSTCSSSSSRVLSHEKAATCYSDRRACMPQAAISLWPQLEATGLTLVSPAVASNAATSGSWLDQFMVQVAAGGLRVDAMALHWFGTDFADPGTVHSPAAGQHLGGVCALSAPRLADPGALHAHALLPWNARNAVCLYNDWEHACA